MFQLNVPRKTTALIQTWGCVLLAIICIFFSFAPLVTLDTGLNSAAIESNIQKVTGENVNLDIPESVDISTIKLVKSIGLVVKVVKALSETAEQQNSEDVADLKELLNSEDSKNLLITVFAMANSVVDAIGSDDKVEGESSSSGLGTILTVMVVIIGLLCTLVFAFIFPIAFICTALVMLIKALTKYNDPIAVAPKIANKLPALITMPMIFMLFQCVVPNMHYGSGALGLWILAAICVLLNVVISRLRTYSKNDLVYATVVQGGALLGGIGYIIFFFNIVKTGICNAFLHGNWGAYVENLQKAKDLEKQAAQAAKYMGLEYTAPEFSNAYLVDGVIILVYLILVLSSIAYFGYCASRVSCNATRDKKSGKISDHHIAFAVCNLVACILPNIIMNSKRLFNNFIDDSLGSYSSMKLSADGEAALKAALVGAIIALIAEIAILVCRKVLCKDLSEDERIAVITGNAKDPEDVAVEEAPAEEAPAEEAPVEEAPKAE